MPPFTKMPPRTPTKSHGLIVRVPICEWCNERVGHPCKGCERITCYACLASLEGGKCVHQTYTPVQSTGWGEECPNPMCDTECNVCYGRGFIYGN